MIANYPALSLVPPLVAIALVIVTKKVLPSLGIGILTAAALVAGSFTGTVKTVWGAFAAIFWDIEAHAVNWYSVLILIFLVVLGVITSLVMMAGGTFAFAEWMMTRIKSRNGAQSLAGGLGMAIFIDDYFNALAVGQVARPITDRHNVSRAKLAYLIDSTSAPVAVLAPFSSWGASIIGIMAPLVAATSLATSDAGAFLISAGMNFYAIGALLLLWLVVFLNINIGPMRSEERRAIIDNQTYDPEVEIPGQLTDTLPRHEPGARRALIVPFIILVLGVIFGILFTGYQATGSFSPMDMLANTDVPMALNYGGVAGLLASIYYYFRYTHKNPDFGAPTFLKGIYGGISSMMPAIYILLFAWMLGDLIKQLGTGEYIGQVVATVNLAPEWLVPLLFIVAAAMAFATGTSWGSFGILLPLAAEILAAVPNGETVLLAAFGSVLAGAVFGDHCSPISDTTILSSTGAQCHLITHVNTQLPYALMGAAASLVGYIAFALTFSGLIGFISMVVTTLLLALGAHKLSDPIEA